MSLEGPVPPKASGPLKDPEGPAAGALISGRYLLRESLGAGGMGSVHLAEDRWRGDRLVALKSAPLADASARAGLEREFALLCRLRHPGVVEAHDFGRCQRERVAWFTMERLDGRPFLEALAGRPFEQQAEAVVQLCRAVDFLHSRGLVHCDLKSENVLVRETAGAGLRVALVDLGLAADPAELERRAEGRFSGTLSHAAPELVGGEGRPGAATDLYALGVLLFEMHAGRPLFETRDPVALAEAHRKQELPELAEACPALGAAARTRLGQLLAKTPAARPPAALPVAEVWAAQAGPGVQPEATESLLAHVRSPRLIGQDEPLAKALDLAVVAADRRAEGLRALRVTGPAGSGKSRVLDEAARAAQLTGVRVLRGRAASEGELHAGLAEPIAEAARLAGEAAGPCLPELVKISSTLMRESGVAPSPPLAQADERLRLGAAAWDTLLAAAVRPLLLVIDDAEALSAEADELLAYLLRRLALAVQAGENPPVAILVGEREQAEESAHLAEVSLQGGSTNTRLLDEQGTGALLDALFPGLDGRDRLAALVQSELGGSAALCERWAATLVREAALCREAEGWRLDFDHEALRRPPQGLADAVAAQLAALDDEARELVVDASLLPGGLAAATLARLSGREAVTLEARLDELERLELLAAPMSAGGRRISAASGLVREAVAGEWSELRRERAAALRDAVEGAPELSFVARAELAEAAGRLEQAAGDWDAALEAARGREDHARTLAAGRRLAAVSEGDRRRLALVRAGLAALELDRRDEAAALREQLGAERPAEASERLVWLDFTARLAHAQGELAAAEELSGERFELAQEGSRERWDAAGSRLMAIARDSAREWEPAAAELRELSAGLREQEAELEMMVAVALLSRNRHAEAVESLGAALQGGLTPGREAAAHNNLGVALLRMGRLEAAAKSLRRAADIRRAIGARAALSGTLVNLALLDIESARSNAAARQLRESLAIKREAGDLPGVVLCLVNLAVAEFQREDFGAMLAICAEVRERHAQVRAGRGLEVLELLEADVRARCGDRAGAGQLLDGLARMESDVGFRAHRPQLLSARLRVAEQDGGGAAERAAVRALLEEDAYPAHDRLDLCCTLAEAELGLPARRRSPVSDAAGDQAAARRFLEELRSIHAEEGPIPAPVSFARHLVAAGAEDLLGRRRSVQRELDAAGALARKVPGRTLRVELAAARGLECARRGDWPGAVARYEEALRLLRAAARRVPAELRESFLAQPAQAGLREALLAAREAGQRGLAAGSFFAPLTGAAARAAAPDTGELKQRALRSDREAKRLREVIEITRDINALVPVGQLLERILDRVLSLMHAERGFIVLSGGDGGTEFAAARDQSGRSVERAEFAVSRSVLDEVIRTGRPVLSSDARSDRRFVSKQSVLLLDLRSVLVAPLVAREEVIGALYVDNSQRAGAFGEEERDLLALFAGQAAVAVENARLHETRIAKDLLDQELSIARGIQERLLPQSLPTLAGFRLAASMRPATELGGDYYDCLELPDGRLRLAIGDVSGKGVPAGLVMVMAHSILRSIGFAEEGLDRILEKANAALEARIEDDKFMTLALLEPQDCGRALKLALAGHEPPLLWRSRSGEIEELEAGGLALGMLPDLGGRLREDRVELEPGDVLLCYTDGVTECKAPDGALYGRERLGEALAAAGPGGAAEVREAIERALDAWRAGADRSDDVTLLVLEAGGEE